MDTNECIRRNQEAIKEGARAILVEIAENSVRQALKRIGRYDLLPPCERESEKAMVASKNLCDSCINFECMFQSGIIRNHCDFYKAGMEVKE